MFIEQLHGTVFDLKVQVQKELGHPVGEQQLFLLPVSSSSSSGDQFLLELNKSHQQPMKNVERFHSDCTVAAAPDADSPMQISLRDLQYPRHGRGKLVVKGRLSSAPRV